MHLQHELQMADMERKYINHDKAQWKEPELAALISEVGGGRNIYIKQPHVLQCKS